MYNFEHPRYVFNENVQRRNVIIKSEFVNRPRLEFYDMITVFFFFVFQS